VEKRWMVKAWAAATSLLVWDCRLRNSATVRRYLSCELGERYESVGWKSTFSSAICWSLGSASRLAEGAGVSFCVSLTSGAALVFSAVFVSAEFGFVASDEEGRSVEVESAYRLGGQTWNERRDIECSRGIDRKISFEGVCSVLHCLDRVDRNNIMKMLCWRCAEKTCELVEI
jgi:hypothetical protein